MVDLRSLRNEVPSSLTSSDSEVLLALTRGASLERFTVKSRVRGIADGSILLRTLRIQIIFAAKTNAAVGPINVLVHSPYLFGTSRKR